MVVLPSWWCVGQFDWLTTQGRTNDVSNSNVCILFVLDVYICFPTKVWEFGFENI